MRFASRLPLFFWAAAGFLRLSAVAGGWSSGLAWAPKVASAPRGPDLATLAGKPVQSLPQTTQRIERFRLAIRV